MASLTARCETTIANGELSFYGGVHSREPGMAESCGCDSVDQSAS